MRSACVYDGKPYPFLGLFFDGTVFQSAHQLSAQQALPTCQRLPSAALKFCGRLLPSIMAPSKVIWHRLAAASGLSAVALGAYGKHIFHLLPCKSRQKTDSKSQAFYVHQVPTNSGQQTSSLLKCGSGVMNIT